MSDDLYATLHVAPDADAKEIKKAYFGLIRQFPPETHPEEFQRLRAAYEVLSDAEQRKAYDARRSEEAATNLGEELAVMMRAAREAMELREFDRARPILQGVLLQRPDAEEARDWLCICLLSLEQFDDALVQANEYVAHHPGKAAAMLLRGYALRGAQRVAEARAAFLKAAELDPLDFRPIRAVVDIDFSTKQLDESLRFIEGRLRDAPESLRLLLRMERVSLLHATGQAVTAAGELEVLEREATTDEAREQLAWFYEREAMLLFSQRRDPTAENIVRRLERLSPGRATVHFSKLATVPLEALPTESLTWLEQQRSAPQLFALPLSGVLTWTSVLLAVALVFVVVGLNAFTSTERWGSTSLVVVALVLAGLGALVGKVLQRWARAANSRLGHFYTLHPFYFAEVDDDVVRLFPLVRLSDSRATHHHTNGGYTHTAFVLGFGGTTLSFSVRSHSEAERFAQLVHECRARMFDLLHGGLLMGDPAADFCPPSALVAPLPARRAW
ncbi:MAG: DnaJ domain-containing protein, partial [Myxococcota bacterium]